MNQQTARMEKAKQMRDEDKLYRFNGVLYPTLMCPEEHLKCLDDIRARDDDIMLVAYPKCGFNWMVGVMRKMIAQATQTENESKMPPLIEFFGPEVVEQAPSPRLLGTHLHPDNMPSTFNEKKTKVRLVCSEKRSYKLRLSAYSDALFSAPCLLAFSCLLLFISFLSLNQNYRKLDLVILFYLFSLIHTRCL
uniref:Sulfotransferase n=1 Tax=Fundulus heteroclitus TaxID=8078 RepID=A0A3Q2PRG3_FUNHE